MRLICLVRDTDSTAAVCIYSIDAGCVFCIVAIDTTAFTINDGGIAEPLYKSDGFLFGIGFANFFGFALPIFTCCDCEYAIGCHVRPLFG